MHVGLVSRVPQDVVAGRFENPVQGDRKFDHSEVRAEVPTSAGDGFHQQLSDLQNELPYLLRGESAQVRRSVDIAQQ
ncbi:hypothetical protein KNE206_77940 [Kitasatospora sp. NE20-6]